LRERDENDYFFVDTGSVVSACKIIPEGIVRVKAPCTAIFLEISRERKLRALQNNFLRAWYPRAKQFLSRYCDSKEECLWCVIPFFNYLPFPQ